MIFFFKTYHNFYGVIQSLHDIHVYIQYNINIKTRLNMLNKPVCEEEKNLKQTLVT